MHINVDNTNEMHYFIDNFSKNYAYQLLIVIFNTKLRLTNKKLIFL